MRLPAIPITTGEITGTLTVRLNCGECGTQLKEASVDLSHTVEVDEKYQGQDLDVELDAESKEN